MKLRALTAFFYGDGPIIQNSEFDVENERHAMSLIATGVAEAAVKLSEPAAPLEEEAPAQEVAAPVESVTPEVKHKSKKK